MSLFKYKTFFSFFFLLGIKICVSQVPQDFLIHRVKKGEMEIKDGTLKEIIRNYTRESGVRNLEREIFKVSRKVVKKIVNE